MIIDILKFELKYQFKSWSFIIFCVGFFLFCLMISSRGFAPVNINFNSPYQITYNILLTSLGCVFAIMIFTSRGLLRDINYDFEHFVYTSRIDKKIFFLSRFLGIYFTGLLAFTFTLFGYYVGTLFPNLNQSRLGEPSLIYYLWVFLVIIVPNIFICTSLIFTVGLLSKNRIATYLSSIFIYCIYFISASFNNSPVMASAVDSEINMSSFSALIDPFGMSAFFYQTFYWNYTQKNSEIIELSGNFLLNRIIWITISTLILCFAYLTCKFKISNQCNTKQVLKNRFSSFKKALQ